MKKIKAGSITFNAEDWTTNRASNPFSPQAGALSSVQDRMKQEADERRGAFFDSDVSFKCAGCMLTKGNRFSTDDGEHYEVLGSEGTTYYAKHIANQP